MLNTKNKIDYERLWLYLLVKIQKKFLCQKRMLKIMMFSQDTCWD